MVSNESDLCCGREVRFGQTNTYKIHSFSGGGNLVFSHCGGIEKEQKNFKSMWIFES
jgi:hypothetical protein